MNKVILMGRLTRDPEISSSTSGTTFARFSIAVDRKFSREGEADADFFNCSAFGKTAEFIERNIHKGTKILVSGRLQNNNYTNKEGQKIYDVRVVVEDVEFGESKKDTNNAETQDDFLNVPDGQDMELPFS